MNEKTIHPHLEGLIETWHARGNEWARIMGGLGDDEEIPRLIKLQIDVLDRCRHELETALAALPGGGVDELIAADREYDAAEEAYVAHHRPLFKRGKEWTEALAPIEARCDAAIARRAAALATLPTPNPHEADRNG